MTNNQRKRSDSSQSAPESQLEENETVKSKARISRHISQENQDVKIVDDHSSKNPPLTQKETNNLFKGGILNLKIEKLTKNDGVESQCETTGCKGNKRKIKDFQDEFMEKYDEFSQSWREKIDRDRRF